jgi:hypothetical protein
MLTSQLESWVQAAITAVGTSASLLPLPVTLHHVVPSLIACMGSGPDVAVALINVASSLGGVTAGRHVLPSLLALLISGGASLPAKQQPLRSAGMTLHPSAVSLTSCDTSTIDIVLSRAPAETQAGRQRRLSWRAS